MGASRHPEATLLRPTTFVQALSTTTYVDDDDVDATYDEFDHLDALTYNIDVSNRCHQVNEHCMYFNSRPLILPTANDKCSVEIGVLCHVGYATLYPTNPDHTGVHIECSVARQNTSIRFVPACFLAMAVELGYQFQCIIMFYASICQCLYAKAPFVHKNKNKINSWTCSVTGVTEFRRLHCFAGVPLCVWPAGVPRRHILQLICLGV